MDRFTKMIMEKQDKFSVTITKGFAVEAIEKAPLFLDKVLKTSHLAVAARDNRFKYEGYTLLTPEEELRAELTTYAGTAKTGSIMGDVSISSVRRVLYRFSFDGEMIWVPMYLPIVSSDNTMTVSDTKYVLMPILTDKMISPAKDHIFIKFYIHKVRLKDKEFETLRELPNEKEFTLHRGLIPYFPRLYAMRDVKPMKGFGAVAPTALYLLAKYGLSRVNSIYGCDVRVIEESEYDRFKNAGYTMYRSMGKQLPEVRRVDAERHSKLVVTKDNDHFSTILSMSIMYSFEAIPSLGNHYEDTLPFWRQALGLLIFGLNISSESLDATIIDHLNSLMTYVDTIARESIREMGYCEVSDDFSFFDLVHLLLENYHTLKEIGILNSETVLDKNLELLYYVLYDIIASFNTTFSHLNKSIKDKKADGSRITHKNVEDIMRSRYMKTKAIFSLSKGTERNLSLMLANTCNDNKILKITSLAELQSRGNGVKKSTGRGKTNTTPDSIELKAEDLVFGNVLYMPKSAVTPRVRLNPFAHFDDRGKLIIPDDLKPLVDEVSKDLKMIAVKNREELEDLLNDSSVNQDLDDV